jgi:PAS domain S-box-containing protein
MTGARILVVEDEKIIARGIEKRLRVLGYEVVGLVPTGEEAVLKAADLRPDLVLMDINLGGRLDGVEAARLIRARTGSPVVFLTAFSDDATLQRAKLTEPHGYILKPFEDKDLQTAIEIGLYKHAIERRLKENEQWLAATLGSIGDGVIATNESGLVRFMNLLAEQLTGWTQAEALGRHVREVFTIVGEKDRLPVPNPVLEALARGAPVSLVPGTVLIDRAGCERPIDDSAAPIRGVTGVVEGAVLVFRDVSERRRLEEHLRQAQKMEAIGRLAGGIAHDFNNIMTVITGFSELLLTDALPAAERREAARNIHEAGKKAADLTAQIMAFSRKQMLVPCDLNLNTVVRDVATMVRRLIGADVGLVTETDPDLVTVKADPSQVAQVILNLAANARDSMPHGGKLVLRTETVRCGADPGPGKPSLKLGTYAVLSVSDTGCGMPEEVLAHLFEPYFTTKGLGHGTGLGLATVYGIVAQSGGHIEVSSAVGTGTTFRVYLPQSEDPAVRPARPERPPVTRGTERVLLVEDDETVRRMTAMVLERNGYTVLQAADGEDGITLGETCAEPIHLLITDLVMPKFCGRQVAERLTARIKTLKVLFISGYTEDVVMKQGIASETMDFLRKPFTLMAFSKKVREILDRP